MIVIKFGKISLMYASAPLGAYRTINESLIVKNRDFYSILNT